MCACVYVNGCALVYVCAMGKGVTMLSSNYKPRVIAADTHIHNMLPPTVPPLTWGLCLASGGGMLGPAELKSPTI